MNDLVFLVDVDNTLLDNDEVRVELESSLGSMIGESRMAQFFEIYESVREEFDFVNFPVAIDRFSRVCDDTDCMAYVSQGLYGFPFSKCVYPGALDAIEHMKSMGPVAILSDGDQLFQRYKIRSAGLEEAVDGRVLIYVHKENEAVDIQARYPAKHYVILDDKPRIHAGVKSALGDLVTTVLVRQGKYAFDTAVKYDPAPDLVIDSIGDVRKLTMSQLLGT